MTFGCRPAQKPILPKLPTTPSRPSVSSRRAGIGTVWKRAFRVSRRTRDWGGVRNGSQRACGASSTDRTQSSMSRSRVRRRKGPRILGHPDRTRQDSLRPPLPARTSPERRASHEDRLYRRQTPTYPAPERGSHRFDTPYTVNETKDGTRICDLDSVQSQANRMEAAFTSDLADVIPQHVVQAGNHQVALTELPHRIADASIRATGLAKGIRKWFLDVGSGDPVPLARIAPTSLIYGAWDSRDTQIRLPRAIRSEIRAHDVSIFTRSAQYSGAFRQESLSAVRIRIRAGPAADST